MIQRQSSLIIIDNSGAKVVKCISILGGFKKKKRLFRGYCSSFCQTDPNKK